MTSPTDQPSNTGGRNPVATALWANAALLAVIAIVLLTRGGAPSLLPAAYGQNQAPIAGGAGIFVMPAQMQINVWGCYLLDVDNKTLCAYQFYPGEKKLRLVAARSYRYDTRLENFNTDIPPKEVKALVERQNAAAAAGNDAPAQQEKDK
jgi:hypothetical protein